jgi:hypothetical protein
MLLQNITFSVPIDIHENWLQWMTRVHIPEIMATGLFVKNQVLRLREVDEEEAFTYAIQFFSATEEDYRTYIKEWAPKMKVKSLKEWGEKVMEFRTLMEIVQ